MYKMKKKYCDIVWILNYVILYYITYCIYIIILVFINCTGKNNMINNVQYKIVIIKYSLINIYLCIYKYIHIYYIENKWTFIHMYLWMYIRVYVHTYIHTYTHTYYFLLSYVTLNTNGNLYVRRDLSNVCITMFMYGTGSTVQYVLVIKLSF